MADINFFAQLVNGIIRNKDISANTLVVTSIKIGAGNTELTQAILDKLIVAQGLQDASGKYTSADVKVVATPTNYSAGSADVEAHLAGIDTAIASAGGTSFGTDVFDIHDNTDITKEIVFDASAITFETTRTITMPDADVDLGALANTVLSNLGSTAINASLLPDGLGSRHLGLPSFKWTNLYVDKTYANQYRLTSNGGGLFGFLEYDETDVVLWSEDSGTADAVATTPIKLRSGSKTGGTGNSGDVTVQTGTSLGGTRGSVILDGLQVDASSSKIVNVSDPTNAQDAATKAYVDASGGTEFDDSVFRVVGSVDPTKKIALEADGITFGTTRTITMPDADVDLGDIAANNAKVSADGLVTTHSDVTDSGSGIIMSDAERTKLGGIEALADVTDSTNVDAAGAVMESDASTANMSFVIDEDDMVSDLATKVPTQQSVKAFVASQLTGAKSYQGGYDASTNTPDLDSTPIAGISSGDVYDVTAAGTFFTISVEVGDSLRATIDTPTLEAHWTIVQSNLTAASIKTQYESNADTNEFSDAEQTKLANISGTNTGDEVAASTTVAGIVELATQAEVDAGSDTTRAVTAASLGTIKTDVDLNTAKVGFTDALAKAAAVADSIADSITDVAPSQNAVFDALALKSDVGHSHAKIVKTMVCGEAFAANTSFMVRIALTGETAGRVYKADKDASVSDKFYAIGFIEGDSAAAKIAGDSVEVIMLGEIVLGSSDTAFASAEIGQAVHVLAAGAFDSLSQITYSSAEASYRGGIVLEVGKVMVGSMQLLGVN